MNPPMRLFLDTNIILDIVEERTAFVEASSAVLVLAEQLNCRLFIAWHGLATTYILSAANAARKRLFWKSIKSLVGRRSLRSRLLRQPELVPTGSLILKTPCNVCLLKTVSLI